jgi:hypothetical protein
MPVMLAEVAIQTVVKPGVAMKIVQSVVLLVATVAASLSCSQASQASHWNLEVSSSAGSAAAGESLKLDLQTGETTIVGFLVVGSASGPVSFAALDLPAFANLRGPVLTLAPGRADAGEYHVTVTATAGGESQTATLHLIAHRFNSAPRWASAFLYFWDQLHNSWGVPCPGGACTADGTVKLQLSPCDSEGDGMTVEVEVVRRGRPFTHVPTHSGSVPARDNTDGTHPSASYCPDVYVALTNLELEQSYDFALRISDQFGAVSKSVEAPDGWYRQQNWEFDQGPCTTRQCACVPSGYSCFPHWGWACCGGACTGDFSSGYRCL